MFDPGIDPNQKIAFYYQSIYGLGNFPQATELFFKLIFFKLDRVGPIHNRPSMLELHQ